MATKKTEPIKIITDLTTQFVSDLGVEAKVEVSEDKTDPEETGYLVSLQGDDLGVLIGFHGETLNALQLLLSLIVSKKIDQWVRLTLDAGDWRAKRSETLQQMALKAAEKVLETGQEQSLPVMPGSDRRQIHLSLQDHEHVQTESTGTEGYRRVVIKPRS